jgi:hypothetical protein
MSSRAGAAQLSRARPLITMQAATSSTAAARICRAWLLKPVLGELQRRLGARRPDHQEHEGNDHQREPDEGEDNDGDGLRRGGRLPGDQLVQRDDIVGARRADQHGEPEPGLAD